jgi:branched-chain amino acid transport system substrate-binding protein
MPVVISKTHIISIKEIGSAYNENCYGATTFYWALENKYPAAKKFVKTFWDKYGAPPSQDGECAYVATKSLFEAMRKAGTTEDVDKVIKTLTTMKLDTPKGEEQFRACDHVRMQSICVIRGKGAKAKGWDVADIVAEVPYTETLQSCENNKKDIPYGQVKLPGK